MDCIDTLIEAEGLCEEPPVRLTQYESRIYGILHKHKGKVVPRGTILDLVYFDRSHGEIPLPRVIDVYLVKIRRKLRGTPFRIEAVFGQGLRLIDESAQ